MARTEEVEVLRFFETGPIDKVEVVFNIICEKMRERLRDRVNPRDTADAGDGVPPRRRRRASSPDASAEQREA